MWSSKTIQDNSKPLRGRGWHAFVYVSTTNLMGLCKFETVYETPVCVTIREVASHVCDRYESHVCMYVHV